MQQEYPVISGNETIGKVQVLRRGLYYQIRCRCDISGAVKYKLTVGCGENTLDLGLCIPYSDGFGIDTSVSVKQLGEGELNFRLVPKHHKLDGRFVPVSAEEPFAYIRQLQQAHLARQNGLIGILFSEDQSSRESPTGQWSEP